MLIAIKGNPLEVLELCDWHWSGGRKHPIAALRERIVRENERLAGQGQRVLGVAFAETDDEALDESTRATWLGLIGMIDPLREAAPALVRELRNAGIVPAMLTGDQAATAAAIARQLGLNGRSSLKVVDSAQERIDEAGEGENGSVDAHVYARVSPADKLQIVRSYQQKGLVVAMTGDGVNDSPALRAADIGIAMGQSGTRVARDIADVLLLDDDILGIVLAVEEGRRVHANIRKAVHYIIASNLSELLVMFGAVALGIGRPLNPRQLLWINLLTDVLPELALALEPGERGVRGRPLDPRVPVVTRSEYRRLVRESVCIAGPTLAAYAATAARRGPSHASGIAFTALTAAQLLHAVGERSGARDASGNRSQVVPAVAAGFGVMAGGVMVPMLRRLLGLGRLGFTDMLVGLAGAGASALANCLTHQQRPASGACIPDLRTTVETS
jgi:Ca2+-transporting ATPase